MAIAGVLSSGLALTLLFNSNAPGSDLFEISKNIDIFTSVYKELNTYYVDDLDPNRIMRTGIDAMLESLDPYTNYISEAELEGYKFQITGNYGGIGATIRPVDGKVTVVDVFEGFPAFKAGLQPGDELKRSMITPFWKMMSHPSANCCEDLPVPRSHSLFSGRAPEKHYNWNLPVKRSTRAMCLISGWWMTIRVISC